MVVLIKYELSIAAIPEFAGLALSMAEIASALALTM
jgi:hypothetical protein